MPSVGLINWSGHKNLGDDAMTKILLDTIPRSVNMKEDPWDADWYILGGGTLIAPQSLFPGRLPNPEKTIGISLGVSCNWAGEHLDILKRMHRIYTRDLFSHGQLLKWGVDNILSVDLLCYLKPEEEVLTDGIWANLMYAPGTIVPEYKEQLSKIKLDLRDKEVNYFAMSPDEDLETIPDAYVYTDAQLLINDLQGADIVYATRLHANVAAWVAGCKNIVKIGYDPKINHFYERVASLTPERARNIIHNHLNDICELL